MVISVASLMTTVLFSTLVAQDLPLSSQDRETLWFPLNESHVRDFTPEGLSTSTELTFYETWLLDSLRQNKSVLHAEIVDRVTVRLDGESRSLQNERGIEVVAPSKAIPSIRARLRRMESTRQDTMLTVSVWLLRFPDAGGRDLEIAVCDRASVQKRLEQLQLNLKGDLVTAPRLTVHNTQRATASVISQTSYVRDYDVCIVENAVLADPVIDVIEEGIKLDVCPILDPDTGSIRMKMGVQCSSLKRPISTLETKLEGVREPVKIQLPELEKSSWESAHIELAAGERGFVVRGFDYRDPNIEGDQEMEVWVLIEEIAVHELGRGRVVGYDPAERKVFVRWNPGATARADSTYDIYRGEDEVGRLRVLEHGESFSICHLESGEAQSGDQVR